MPYSIEIDVDADAAIRRLEAMQLRATNFRPVFWYAQAQLETANARNFSANGLPVGGWDERKRTYGWPLLRRTGRLFQSLTTLRGAPNEINRTDATFGTEVEYARFHQRGTWKMAKRQIVFEPVGFAEKTGRVAAKYIVNGVVPD